MESDGRYTRIRLHRFVSDGESGLRTVRSGCITALPLSYWPSLTSVVIGGRRDLSQRCFEPLGEKLGFERSEIREPGRNRTCDLFRVREEIPIFTTGLMSPSEMAGCAAARSREPVEQGMSSVPDELSEIVCRVNCPHPAPKDALPNPWVSSFDEVWWRKYPATLRVACSSQRDCNGAARVHSKMALPSEPSSSRRRRHSTPNYV